MPFKSVVVTRALWRATVGARRSGAPGLRERVKALPRMIGLSLTGRYTQLSRMRLAALALGTVYVLSPIDLIPEMILPLIGWADDAVVLAWVLGTLLVETEAFLAWEAAQNRVVPGEVVTGDVASRGLGR